MNAIFWSYFDKHPIITGFVVTLGALLFAVSIFAVPSMIIVSGYNPQFVPGSMVHIKVSGATGMVVRRSCTIAAGTCVYSVRLPGAQMKTNTGLFRDGSIEMTPVSIVHGLKEFELEGAR